MAEKETKQEETAEKAEEESLMDYASKRLVELKNSERTFMQNVTQAQANLEQAKADVIACRGRIDEMSRIIEGQSLPPKKP